MNFMLELGKRYRVRNGSVSSPVFRTDDDAAYCATINGVGFRFWPDGQLNYGTPSDGDLVEEYVENVAGTDPEAFVFWKGKQVKFDPATSEIRTFTPAVPERGVDGPVCGEVRCDVPAPDSVKLFYPNGDEKWVPLSEINVNSGDRVSTFSQFANATGTPVDPPSAEGRKDDSGKPRYDLIAPEFLDEIAKVLDLGAKKYAARNWEQGMSWGRCFAALMRHAWAWWRGEECDPETGLSHLSHLACNAMFLLAYSKRKTGTDDRWKGLNP